MLLLSPQACPDPQKEPLCRRTFLETESFLPPAAGRIARKARSQLWKLRPSDRSFHIILERSCLACPLRAEEGATLRSLLPPNLVFVSLLPLSGIIGEGRHHRNRGRYDRPVVPSTSPWAVSSFCSRRYGEVATKRRGRCDSLGGAGATAVMARATLWSFLPLNLVSVSLLPLFPQVEWHEGIYDRCLRRHGLPVVLSTLAWTILSFCFCRDGEAVTKT